jgi:DNA topoisomerase I
MRLRAKRVLNKREIKAPTENSWPIPHLELRAAGEDAAQRALYTLIWNRAVASQLADAMFSVNTVKLESLDSDQRFLFKAVVGRTLLSPGWKSLTAKDAAEEEEPNSGDDETPNGGSVPSLASGSAVTAESGRVLKKQTPRRLATPRRA